MPLIFLLFCLVLEEMHLITTYRRLIFLCLFGIFSSSLFATNLDSLYKVAGDKSQADTARLQALQSIAWDQLNSNPDSCIAAGTRQLKLAQQKDQPKWESSAYTTIGAGYWTQGNYYAALEQYKKSLEIEQRIGNKKGIANSYNNIGIIYDEVGDYPKAVEYYEKSLLIKEEISDKPGLATSYNNIGVIYDVQGDYNKALEYFNKSLAIDKELNNIGGMAETYSNIGQIYGKQGNHSQALDNYLKSVDYNIEAGNKRGLANVYNNIGNTYKRQGNYTQALDYLNKCLAIKKELGDQAGIANTYNGIGFTHLDKRDFRKAVEWCNKGLEKGEASRNINAQYQACGCMYEAFKRLKKYDNALAFLEHMLSLEDSLKLDETSSKLQQLEFASELKLQEVEFKNQMVADSLKEEEEKLRVELAHKEEVKREAKIRNYILIAGIGILLLAFGLFSRLRFVRKSRAMIKEERDRSENLLLNILPEEIAKELKEKGKADARNFDAVTILFTDFKEFTQASEKLTAKELVEEINVCFEAFDKIIEKYGVEKIKTIGDAYMAAGGLPVPEMESVKHTVMAALEMQDFIVKRHDARAKEGKYSFEMRVGIHSGPAIAGIVGVKKFQYDVWGDTVNTAARMESSGEVGKVNISEDTYNLVKDEAIFEFESRGKVEAKHKGYD